MEIGNKLLELRRKNNFSQEQLAEKLGVARQTISKWELGETSPDLNQAKQLSKIFNISLDEMTNNDIKDILITKMSNTDRLAGIIINILKAIGVLIIVVLIMIAFVFACKKYFEVKPNNLVADSYVVYCYLNGERHYYKATITKENPDTIELYSSDKKTINEMNIDTSKYKSKEKLIKDIKKYVISQGGTCGH